jgi:hypothetical protein
VQLNRKLCRSLNLEGLGQGGILEALISGQNEGHATALLVAPPTPPALPFQRRSVIALGFAGARRGVNICGFYLRG